jgi:acetyl esterase/lipase
MNKKVIYPIFCALVLAGQILCAEAQQQTDGPSGVNKYAPREIPARTIPVPDTVSQELQKAIAIPLDPALGASPANNEEWRALVARKSEMNVKPFSVMREMFPVDIETVTISGVKAQIVTPRNIPAENSNRVLIHLRGGGYVFNGGESGIGEAILMAFHGKFRVISVDYRMAPDFPYPAALEDAVNVYKDVLKTCDPRRVGIFGTSAGGGLAAATTLKLRESGLPLPAALGLGTPWADLTKSGDTLFTNEFIDNVIVTNEGMLAGCARLYAGANDMRDPYISPVYGDYTKGFPPTILTAGTRDLFLSDTVRMNRKLSQAGVTTRLQVFEGMSHAQYISAFTAPESKEAFEEIAKFFDKHLER